MKPNLYSTLPAAVARRPDAAIRRDLLARLERQPWWRPAVSNVFVADGVAIFQGLFSRRDERQAARLIAQATPGLVCVRDDRVRAREWQSMA